VNVFDVRFHVPAPRGQILRGEIFLGQCRLKVLTETGLQCIRQKLLESLGRPFRERTIGSRDRRTEVAPGGLKPGVRRSFSCAMETHQGFEKVPVCQVSGFGSQASHFQRTLEGLPDFSLILLLNPYQDLMDVASGERFPGCRYDGSVESVTMGGGHSAEQQKRSCDKNAEPHPRNKEL
jgi:hypothetical protein